MSRLFPFPWDVPHVFNSYRCRSWLSRLLQSLSHTTDWVLQSLSHTTDWVLQSLSHTTIQIHFDAPRLERFGTSLPGDCDWLSHSRRCPVRSKTVAICNIRTAIHSKNHAIQWHFDQDCSRSLVPCTIWNDLPAKLKDSSLSKTRLENCLRHFYLIDYRYIFAHSQFLLCAEKSFHREYFIPRDYYNIMHVFAFSFS